jgi:putative transcriptional regulator
MKLFQPNYPALVKDVCRQLSISQEDLARKLGVNYATVNRWENGQAKPSKLARTQLDAFCERMWVAGMLDFAENGHG